MWQFFYLIWKGHTASNKSTSAQLYLDYSSRLIDLANQVKLKSLKYNKQKNCHQIFEIQMNYNVQIKFVCVLSTCMEEINKKKTFILWSMLDFPVDFRANSILEIK